MTGTFFSLSSGLADVSKPELGYGQLRQRVSIRLARCPLYDRRKLWVMKWLFMQKFLFITQSFAVQLQSLLLSSKFIPPCNEIGILGQIFLQRELASAVPISNFSMRNGNNSFAMALTNRGSIDRRHCSTDPAGSQRFPDLGHSSVLEAA